MIRLPNWVYGAGAVVLGSALALVLTLSYGAGRYQAGRDSVTANVRVDTVTVNTLRRADSTAKAATDTIVKRLTVTRWKVDTLIRQVPDSLIAVPEIQALVGSVALLTSQVDTLTRTLDVERATSRLRASVDSAALVSARVVIVAQSDSIKTLERRPRWATVVKSSIGAGLLGAVSAVILKE